MHRAIGGRLKPRLLRLRRPAPGTWPRPVSRASCAIQDARADSSEIARQLAQHILAVCSGAQRILGQLKIVRELASSEPSRQPATVVRALQYSCPKATAAWNIYARQLARPTTLTTSDCASPTLVVTKRSCRSHSRDFRKPNQNRFGPRLRLRPLSGPTRPKLGVWV